MAPPRGAVPRITNSKKKLASRKNRRKEERAAKKRKRASYSSRERLQEVLVEEKAKKPTTAPKSGVSKKIYKDPSATRKTRLLRANEDEKKEISKLEKLLKINKKKKSLPSSFQEDGLNYLLDLTERDSAEWNLSDDSYDDGGGGGEMYQHASDLESDADSDPPSLLPIPGRRRKQGPGPPPLTRELEVKGIVKTRDERKHKPSKNKVRFSEDCTSTDDVVSEETTTSCHGIKGEVSCHGTTTDFDDLMDEMDDLEEMNESEEEGGRESDDIECEEGDSDGGEEEGESDSGEEEGGGDSDDIECEEGDSDGYLDSNEEAEEMEHAVGGSHGGNGGEVEGRGGLAKDRDSAMKYIPPHLRDNSKSERLRKRIQGLVNRLSESNMKSISSSLEQLYSENSRNEMNATLWEVLEKTCVGPVLITERFAMEQTMLITLLHHHVGTEVGAYIIQKIVSKLDGYLWSSDRVGAGKEADCLVLLLAQLYNYQVIHCLLVYDVIRKLVESFDEKDIELLLLLLKNAGMEIRRDDSRSLKDIILQIQSKSADSALSSSSRIKFMLETISALRTNNSRKIPNYDPSLLGHMKKLLRGLLRTSGPLDEAQLKVSLHDLLNADRQGRWWVVGSAWSGRDTPLGGTGGSHLGGKASSESWVLELARKQRMNTDIRRTVFGIIMTSEDYVDGFQKLVGLGLKPVQEREMVHVLVDCCLQEKVFNPYYAYLGQKLCEFKKGNQVTFQFSLWDRFKTLDTLTSTNRSNLRQLSCHFITKKALSLSILKIVEFTELTKCGIKFYKSLLTSLLTESSEPTMKETFSRIAPLPHLKKLRDRLFVFLNHYLLTADEGTLLNQRIKIAEHALRAEGNLF